MKRVAIVCKPNREELAQLLPELIGWLREHGYEPILDEEAGKYTDAAPACERSRLPELKPGLVIVPMHAGKEIGKGLLHSILKKAGLK